MDLDWDLHASSSPAPNYGPIAVNCQLHLSRSVQSFGVKRSRQVKDQEDDQLLAAHRQRDYDHTVRLKAAESAQRVLREFGPTPDPFPCAVSLRGGFRSSSSLTDEFSCPAFVDTERKHTMFVKNLGFSSIAAAGLPSSHTQLDEEDIDTHSPDDDDDDDGDDDGDIEETCMALAAPLPSAEQLDLQDGSKVKRMRNKHHADNIRVRLLTGAVVTLKHVDLEQPVLDAYCETMSRVQHRAFAEMQGLIK